MTVRQLIACLAVIASAGCALASATPDDTVVLETWANTRDPLWTHYAKQNPHIRFRVTRGIEVENASGTSALLLAMAGNTAPDFMYTALERVATFCGHNFLYPLDTILSDAQREALDEWIDPSMREALGAGDPAKLYVIPFFYTTEALWYRRDLFKKAGLDMNKPPRDWNELYTAARELSHPEEGRYGFFFPTGLHAGYGFIAYVWSAGGDLVRRSEEDGVLRCVFDERPGILALNFVKKLRWSRWARCDACGHTFDVESVDILTGKFTLHDQPRCGHCEKIHVHANLEQAGRISTGVISRDAMLAPVTGLTQGTVAMGVGSSSGMLMLPLEMDPARVGITAFPRAPVPEGRTVFKMNAGGYAVNGQLRDPKRLQAAVDFVTYLASDEARRIHIAALVNDGFAGHINPHFLEKYGFKEHARLTPPEWRDLNDQVREHGRVMPLSPGFMNVMSTELNDAVLKIVDARPHRVRSLDAQAIMSRAVEVSNTKLLGLKDVEQYRVRRRIAFAVVIAMFLAMAVGGYRYVRLVIQKNKSSASGFTSIETSKAYHLTAWAFMIPALASVLLWKYYPLLLGSVIAFQDYKIVGDSAFVGLDNFIEALWNDRFWHSLGLTFYYLALNFILVFPAPIIMAILLAEVPRGKYMFRTIMYLPAMVSGIVVLFMWKSFYDPSPNGLLNTLLGYVGIDPVGWLKDPKLAMLCVVLPTAWSTAGPGCLIYLAALKGIPDELYEAAAIDGAGFLHKVFNVTLPNLKALLFIQGLGMFVGSFHTMGNILPLTGGGPANATNVIGIEIWRSSFLFLRFGYAASVAWILGAMLIGLTVYQLKILQQVEFKRAENF